MEEERRQFLENRKEMVLAVIEDQKLKPMRFRELAGFLQIPRADRNDLVLVLEELIREGKVAVNGNGCYVSGSSVMVRGEYLASGRGFGFVRPEEGDDIFIPEKWTGGAIHKDQVLVTILSEAQTANGRTIRREGAVSRVLEHGYTEVVGIYRQKKDFGFVIPDVLKLDFDVYIPKEHTKGAQNGQKVVAKIVHYGNGKKNPEGAIIEILGGENEPGVDVMSVIRSFELPYEFSDELLLEAERVAQEDLAEAMEGRLDYREVPTVTIDGEDAKDLDDAISLTVCDGHYYLGVHIADVTHYVREGSLLDTEAKKRGTSVYLADRVIPMLPRVLSNGMCSLNAGEDRLALSCLMELDDKGTLVGMQVAETVIHVDHRMTYTDVNAIVNRLSEETLARYQDWIPFFDMMKELAQKLRRLRHERGAMDFDFPESKIVIDEKGRVADIHPYERNEATKIIEDFMLMANEAVAEHFYWMTIPFVYRTHEEPDPDKVRKLSLFVANFGYHLHLGNGKLHTKEFQKLLEKLEGSPYEALISRLTLRAMRQAKYDTECAGHFGLASQFYTHFTSPIRRYPDLQIHRIIKESLHGTLDERRLRHYESILPEVCRQACMTERRAEEAERDVEKLKKALYMRRFLGETFTGVVSGVTGWGIYVELPNTVEGMISLGNLTDDYYVYDETNLCLIGEHHRKKISLGDTIEIVVVNTDKVARTIDFMPAIP